MEGYNEKCEKSCCCNKCTNYAEKLSSELERFSFLNGFSTNNTREIICSILSAHNNYLPSHKVEKQASLHYLAQEPFQPGDEQGLEEIISFLCHSGYDINKREDYTQNSVSSFPTVCQGLTPLLAAVSGRRNVTLVKCLLRNGAQADILDGNGYSALHWAVFNENVECFQTLIVHGALASRELGTGGNVPPILHMTIAEGTTKMVECLLEQGLVDPTETANYKVLPPSKLHFYLDKISLVHSWNVSKSAETLLQGFNPFRAAILQKKGEMAELLFQNEAVKNGISLRDLNLCIAAGYTKLASKMLVSIHTALEDSKIKGEWSLLCLPKIAFRDKDRVKWTKKLIQFYLERGWDINTVSKGSVKELVKRWFWRVQVDWTEFCGPSPETMSKFTLLHLACYSGAPLEMIKFLVNKGADINMKTEGDFKVTPLLLAILMGMEDVAMYLVEKGADLNIKGALKGVVFTDLGDELTNSYTIPDEDNQFGSFSAVELVLRCGYCNGGQLLEKMLDTGINWHGTEEFRLAVEGGDVDNVWKILKDRDPEEVVGDLNWLSWKSSDCPKIPSLLYLLYAADKNKEFTSYDTLLNIMDMMVYDFDYDCNLVTSTEDAEEIASKLQEHMIFLCLQLDFDFYENDNPNFQLVKALLKVSDVDLDVTNLEGENPVEYVINRLSTSKDGYELCKLLISHGVDVSEMEFEKSDYKTKIFHPQLIKLLFKNGAKLDKKFFNPSFKELEKLNKFKDSKQIWKYIKNVKNLEDEYEKQWTTSEESSDDA